MRRLFVEDVAGVAVVCEESKAYGTLLALPHLEMFRANSISFEELYGLSAHDVCTCIANESTGHTSSSDTDDAVEAAAAMYCSLRLSIPKEDVENSLSYPDDFSVVFH